MIKKYLPLLFGAALTGCAVFIYDARTFVLAALMLFLPLFDRQWSLPESTKYTYHQPVLLILCALIFLLAGINPEHGLFILSTLLLVALPEEWFFRAYFMMRIKRMGLVAYQANIMTSLFFALLHLPTQGLFGLSVFIPSLIYGYLYQHSRDVVLVVLLHAVSNIIFFIYIREFLEEYA